MKNGQDCLSGFCLLFLLFFCACHSTSREQVPSEKDFTIIFGSGGGFTGMAEGYIIRSNGKIEKWSGRYFRHDKVDAFGTVSQKALKPVRQMFDTKAFAKWSYQQTGNMTTRLWCISGKDTTTVSWSGLEPDKDVPQPIQDFYSKLKQTIESVSKP
jgi:hypothetical protein